MNIKEKFSIQIFQTKIQSMVVHHYSDGTIKFEKFMDYKYGFQMNRISTINKLLKIIIMKWGAIKFEQFVDQKHYNFSFF